jgi:hypothetical protein
MFVWAYGLIVGWVIINITRIFYFLIIIPWVILIIIVWINWRKIYIDIRGEKYKLHHFDPLYIRAGLVRLFQIVLIFIVFIYYIIMQINALVLVVPTGLLVVVNAILAYFGFSPSEMLPEDYVIESLNIEVPENKKLLNSLPLLKSALNEFEKKFNSALDDLDAFVEKPIEKGEEILESFNERITDVEKMFKNIPIRIFNRDPFDKYNYMLLLILLAVINIVAQPAFAIPTYIALPTFSIFGILIGVSARGQINGNISNKIFENLEKLRANLQSFQNDLKSVAGLTKDFKQKMHEIYEEFKESNFLDYLPVNYSSLLSVGFVSFLSLFVFILPLPVPETIFTTIQWFVLYYFTSKQ